MEDKILSILTSAAGGLLFPSETDAPFEPFVWEAVMNTPEVVRGLAGQSRSVRCEQVSLDDFFADLLQEKEFQSLRATIQTTLSDVKVYRFGSIKVTCFVVGTAADGRLAGLTTTAVET